MRPPDSPEVLCELCAIRRIRAFLCASLRLRRLAGTAVWASRQPQACLRQLKVTSAGTAVWASHRRSGCDRSLRVYRLKG